MAKTQPPTETTTISQIETQHQQQQEPKQRFNSDDRKDLEKKNCNQEGKDDWRVTDHDNMNENNDVNISVPSFIRLFVIRRIIDKYIQNNKDEKKDKTKEEIIKELTKVFKS